MCVGIPMQVIEKGEGYAVCEGMGEKRQINTLLVGDHAVGTWLLTFLGTAREVISAEEASRISDALSALNLIMQGETDIDHLFADLVDREPTLPDFVQSAKRKEPFGD